MEIDGEIVNINLCGLQIKSLEKAQKLASAISIIEEECG